MGASVAGHRVVGTDADLPRLVQATADVLVAVGQIKTAEPRIRLFERLAAAGGRFPVVVSPRAYVSSHAEVGAGTVVLHGAVVNAGARVGRNCIINSLALIEHGVAVADHCHVATAATVNSGVRIGPGTFIGSGSRIRQGVIVGERSVVGMGQIVLRDCPAGTWLPRKANPA